MPSPLRKFFVVGIDFFFLVSLYVYFYFIHNCGVSWGLFIYSIIFDELQFVLFSYDTKCIAEYHLSTEASYLEYLYHKWYVGQRIII